MQQRCLGNIFQMLQLVPFLQATRLAEYNKISADIKTGKKRRHDLHDIGKSFGIVLEANGHLPAIGRK